MKLRHSLLVLTAVFALARSTRADDIVKIVATDVRLGNSTFNSSFEYDSTIDKVILGTVNISFSDDSALGGRFLLLANDDNGAAFDFLDSDGDLLQFDSLEFNVINTTGAVFPGVGSYPVPFVDTVCARPSHGFDECGIDVGPGYTNGNSGSLIVSAVPEPSSSSMLLIGFLILTLLSIRRILNLAF